MKENNQMKKIWLNKKLTLGVSALIIGCVLIGGEVGSGQQNPTVPKTIYYDYPDEQGALTGGIIVVEAEKIEVPETLFLDSGWNVETIIYNGDSNNRIDLVILGDGYDVNDINDGLYAADVNSVIDGFFAELPLDEYASYFNVHRVDVISNESGVDYDPCGPFSPDPTLKDTALNMQYWTWGIERLLGWDPIEEIELLVLPAANLAPDRDYVLALANSAKYGGAGYFDDDLATACGHEEFGRTNQIALHESGHSFAKLNDEYFYEPTEVYNGTDVLDLKANTSDTNNLGTTKWYRWLGVPTVPPEHAPNDIDTYPGATVLNITRSNKWVAYRDGVYRPTLWSKMRELADANDVPYPFHQVNVEQFVLKIYDEIVSPIDDATPPGTYPVGTASIPFFVEPLQPATHSLDVQWYLDGNSIPGATGTTLNASTLDMSPGKHTLDVNVIDNTDLVQDEGERERLMSDSRTWTLMKRALVGYWNLDETSGTIAADSSIYDNNGILNNMDPNTDWVAGKINGALDFDGEDDYVSLYPIPVLAGENVTISAWIKANDVNEGLHPVVSQYEYDGVNYYGYLLYLSGNQPRFFLGGAGRAEALDVTVSTVDWYHLTGTNDGKNLKIYVNGEPKGSISSYGHTGVNLDTYIGYDGEEHYFAGKIDDVRVYNWALDANEVWELSYESNADFNGDDIVNFLDYAVFANAWQTTLGDPDYNDICDLADNNSIDCNDLALFTDDWLWQAGGAMLMGQSMSQTMSQSLALTEGLSLSAPVKQPQAQIEPLDIEEIIKWLDELWLADEELREIISEDDWQKFIESVKQSM